MLSQFRTRLKASDAGEPRPLNAKLWPVWLMLTLFISILVGIGTSVWVERHNNEKLENRLEALASQSVSLVRERLGRYVYGLRGARGAVVTAGVDRMTREDFRRYMGTRDLEKEFPGSHGFAFARHVAPADVDRFVATMRERDSPDYAVRELNPNDKDRFLVQFIEPEITNQPAIGLDLGSEVTRRVAAEEAEASGEAVLTGPITLVQDPIPNGGVLFMFPVYRGVQLPIDRDSRKGQALGWVYTPLLLREVLLDLDPLGRDQYQLLISDVDKAGRAIPTYETNPASPVVTWGNRIMDAQVFGRVWRMEVRPTQLMVDNLNLNSPASSGIAVGIASLMLMGLAYFYAMSKLRARQAHSGHAKLAAIVESSVDAIIGKRTDGTVISWNRAAEEMFGYSREEAVGKRMVELIIPEDLMDEESMILGRIASGERIEHFETIRKTKDGRHLDVSVAVSPIRNEDGEIVGASKTVRDITKQKETERRIQQLNANLEQQVVRRTSELEEALETARLATKAKSYFLANMSHEIRTPLNAVLGMAYMAEKETHELATRQRLGKISRAGRSLLNLINDILDFSKIEQGHLEIEHTTFDLQQVMDNIAAIMSASAQGKPVEVVVQPPPRGVRFVKGDSFRLEQVLINLVGNALKFTSEGHVVVSARVIEKSESNLVLRFAVQDTGLGIPEAKQRAIFAPFTQVDASTSRHFGGSGLGLSICRQLVALMGGEIGVISAEGHGSEFWFTVTLEPTEAEVVTTPLQGLKALVVDDNELALEALVQTSKSLGWSPVAAVDGESALEKFKKLSASSDEGPPDVLILDWQMPGMDGLELARAVKQQPAAAPVVIMVTGHPTEDMAEHLANQVVDSVLSKPVTASSLLDSVAIALQRRGKIESSIVSAGEGQTNLNGLKILVVDDNEINRELAVSILTSHGAMVDALCDGKEAVDALTHDRHRYDLVLMDLQMPSMDGMQATSLIRQLEGCERLPIVALTAGAFTEQREAALAAGMDAVVTKPFDVEKTIRLIIRLVGREAPTAPPVPDVLTMPVKTKGKDKGSGVDGKDGKVPVDVDFNAGLATWQDLGHYRHYLRRFVQDQASIDQVVAGLAAEDLMRFAHKLRGTALSLALPAIVEVSDTLERKLRSGSDEPEERQRFIAVIERARVVIQEYLDRGKTG